MKTKLILILSTLLINAALRSESCQSSKELEDPIFEKFCKNPTSVICDSKNFKSNQKSIRRIALKPFYETIESSVDLFKIHGINELDTSQFFDFDIKMFNRCGSQEEIPKTCGWGEINSKLDTVLNKYLEKEEQVIKLKENLFAEYYQRQQQHLSDIIEPKEDLLEDIFNSSIETFSTSIKNHLSKQYSGKQKEEKIKSALELLNRIKPLFSLNPKAEARFKDSYDFARDGFIRNCTYYGVFGSAFVPGQKLSELPHNIPVTFCPSFMAEIYNKENIEDHRDEIFFKMLMVITHELGHLFGHEKHMVISPKRASETILCMANHYPGSWLTKGILIDYKDEIMADIFAADSISRELENRSYSKMKKLRLLTSSYKILCGTKDDGVHPSGSFRLNEILLREPGIFKMFGCKKFYRKQNLYSCSEHKPKLLRFPNP